MDLATDLGFFPPSFPSDELLARFAVVGELGRGGLGVVLHVRERSSGRELALKLPLVKPTASRVERFRREGRITARLEHPGIIRIHEAGEIGGWPYLVYELIPGCRSLDEASEDLELRERTGLLLDVASALGNAHAKGVVHRDLKPDNLLVDSMGRVRVADFGLALTQDLERLTKTGGVLGTPTHMAPEQASGDKEQIGPATDVWAMGVLLYSALTDRLPFEGPNLTQLMAQVIAADPPRPSQLASNVPPELEAICLKALARRPIDRYADGAALAQDLERYLCGQPTGLVGRRRRRRALYGLGALVGTLLLGIPLLSVARARSTTGTAALSPAPRLQITSPGESDTWEAEFLVRGEIKATTAQVHVELKGVGAKTFPPGPFSWRVPLVAGENRLTFEVVDQEDRAGESLVVTVTRHRVPAWFEKLDRSRRAELPLPEGLEFSLEDPGYVNTRDDSLLVWVPPGRFLMGSTLGRAAEEPVHEVVLTKGYFMGKYEVTWGQYLRFCKETSRTAPAPDPEHHSGSAPLKDYPVYGVNWDDATAYSTWAGLRLPTEAEWEFAARGTDGRAYPWGDDANDALANSKKEGGVLFLSPVRAFPKGASFFGLLNMAGNVCEWVQDRASASYPAAPQVDPQGPGPGGFEARVVRGGAWKSKLKRCRTTSRGACAPKAHSDEIGFRVSRNAQVP